MYEDGTGVPLDHAEAARWYRLAADQGGRHGSVQSWTDVRGWHRGPLDHAKAARLAANQGYTAAQCNLGVMCRNGEGVPQNHAEAARLCRLAADQGSATAQFNLGCMSYTGEGVPQDHIEAARLLKLACDQGCHQARKNNGALAAQYPASTRVQNTGITTAAHLNGGLETAVKLTKPLVVDRIAVRIDVQSKSVLLSWANLGHVGAGRAPR